MGITLSGSLDITGSLFVNGTAVSTGSGGGGSVPASVTAGANINYNAFGFLNPDYVIDVPAASVTNVHVSQSGVYLMSGSFTTTQSASVNIYYYPDELSAGENAAVWFTHLGTVSSTSVRYTISTIISGSAGQTYWSAVNTLGTVTTTVTSGLANTETKVLYRGILSGQQNPNFFYKVNNTNSIVTQPIGSSGLWQNALFQAYTGSIGTPIV